MLDRPIALVPYAFGDRVDYDSLGQSSGSPLVYVFCTPWKIAIVFFPICTVNAYLQGVFRSLPKF